MDARDPEMAVVYLDLPPVSQLREGETLRQWAEKSWSEGRGDPRSS